MVYPVIIAGEKVGRLTVEREGLFTVFEAELPGREGILRLSVYGESRETYLGVMQQWQGGLYLRKKLSRSALRSFPQQIDYAGESGQCPASDDGAGTCREAIMQEAAEIKPREEAETNKEESASIHNGNDAQDNIDAQVMAGGELLWFSAPSGVLSAFDGKHSLVAIPADVKSSPTGADLRRIGERQYFVFIK